jgi:PAS domain S-box-containing protein
VTQEIVTGIISNKKNIFIESKISPMGGNPIFVRVNIDFIGDSNKSLTLMTIIDIDAQKKAEINIRESKEKYQLLMKTVNEAIITVDTITEKIIAVNDKAVELFKSNNKNLVGSQHSDYYFSDEENKYQNFFKKSLIGSNNDSSLDIFLKQVGGKKIPVRIDIKTALVGNRMVAQIIFYDMSNRLKREERRRLLATVVDQAAESVIITDIYGNIQYVNPAFEEISGYSYTEVLGKNPRLLQSGEVPSYHYNLMWKEISNGNVWRGTFTNRRKDGSVYKEEATITPVKDNNGIIINYVAVKRDITQHLILENQIRQSQKMHAIGTLAGGVAHDFNNILTAILGYAELSQVRCSKKSLLYENLGEIIRAADRAGKLVDQILKFSRQGEKNISSLKLSLIVKEVLKLLRASLPANIELVADISPNAFVKADPTQMHQIVMNLCTNAYQALEGKGGCIHIQLNTIELLPRQGIEIGNLHHGTYVCLQVKDNGNGIPREYLQRIFEPYFTTKKMHEGTGLGLSVVHGIVNDHGGAVTVESIPGKGSCFKVFLPQAEEEIENDVATQKIVRRTDGGRILVVDDEQPIVSFIVQVLEPIGYTVQACFSAELAYKIFKKQPLSFDLVITDMGMPGMTGLELAGKFKKLDPTVPIILCTGFSEYVTAENYKKMGLAGFVSKPFSAESLLREVDKVLSENEERN